QRPDGRRAAGAGARADSACGRASGVAGAGVRHPGRERDPRGACGGAARPRAGYRARPTGERRVSDASAAARLDQLRALARAEDDQVLKYPADSAGGLMSTEVVTVDEEASLVEAIADIRRQSAEDDALYQVYAVDGARRLKGVVPVARLIVASPARRVREVMEAPAAAVRPEIDQEQVARLMARYNVAAVP